MRQQANVDDRKCCFMPGMVSMLRRIMFTWCRHVLRKVDGDDWIRRCLDYEGTRPRGRYEKTWKAVVDSDLCPVL